MLPRSLLNGLFTLVGQHHFELILNTDVLTLLLTLELVVVAQTSSVVVLIFRMLQLDLTLRDVLMKMVRSMRTVLSLSMVVVQMVSPRPRVSISKAVTRLLHARMLSGAAVMI